MANPQNTATMQRGTKAAPAQSNSMAIIAPLAGWFLPGLGHFIQRRWIRGLLLMLSVFIMFFVGLAMQGKVYAFNTGDLLDMLGFVGDVGAGALYFVARRIGASATSTARWPIMAPSTSLWRDC
jgi:hypothetical protein